MHRSGPRAALLATLAAFALAACTAGSATPAATAAAPASTAQSPAGGGGGDAVTIKDFAFAPGTLEVAVGTTVNWTNQDSTAHTVTADDGSFDSKSIAAGGGFSQAFSTAGTFAYHCTIHTSMTATITVK